MTMNEILRRQEAAEASLLDHDPIGSETVINGHTRSTIRGTDTERLKIRMELNELHARGLLGRRASNGCPLTR